MSVTIVILDDTWYMVAKAIIAEMNFTEQGFFWTTIFFTVKPTITI
jgi:hypothetical protein